MEPLISLIVILLLSISNICIWLELRASEKKQEEEYIRGWDDCRDLAMSQAERYNYNLVKVCTDLFGGEGLKGGKYVKTKDRQ